MVNINKDLKKEKKGWSVLSNAKGHPGKGILLAKAQRHGVLSLTPGPWTPEDSASFQALSPMSTLSKS